jgi:hypothetical protein
MVSCKSPWKSEDFHVNVTLYRSKFFRAWNFNITTEVIQSHHCNAIFVADNVQKPHTHTHTLLVLHQLADMCHDVSLPRPVVT